VSFYGSIKTYHNQEVSKWLMANPGRTVTQYQISSLFSTAYEKAATTENAQSDFRKTGIWPVNADISYLKTYGSLSQRPPKGLSQNQMETSTPIQDQVRMSDVLLLHILKLNKVKNQVSPAQTKKTPNECSICSHTKWKKVCANSNNFSSSSGQLKCPKGIEKTKSCIHCINQQPLCK
jgi:hypothetical protein